MHLISDPCAGRLSLSSNVESRRRKWWCTFIQMKTDFRGGTSSSGEGDASHHVAKNSDRQKEQLFDV